MADTLGIASAFVSGLKDINKAAEEKRKSDEKFQKEIQLFDLQASGQKLRNRAAQLEIESFGDKETREAARDRAKREADIRIRDLERRETEGIKIQNRIDSLQTKEKAGTLTLKEELDLEALTRLPVNVPSEIANIQAQRDQLVRDRADEEARRQKRDAFNEKMEAFNTGGIDIGETPFFPPQPTLPEPLALPPEVPAPGGVAQLPPELAGVEDFRAQLGLPPGTPEDVAAVVGDAFTEEEAAIVAPVPETGASRLKTLTNSFTDLQLELQALQNEAKVNGVLDEHPELQNLENHPRLIKAAEAIKDLQVQEQLESTRIATLKTARNLVPALPGDAGSFEIPNSFTGKSELVIFDEFRDLQIDKLRAEVEGIGKEDELSKFQGFQLTDSAVKNIVDVGPTPVFAENVDAVRSALTAQEEEFTEKDLGGGNVEFTKKGKTTSEISREAGTKRLGVSLKDTAKKFLEANETPVILIEKTPIIGTKEGAIPQELSFGFAFDRAKAENDFRPIVEAVIASLPESQLTVKEVTNAVIATFEQDGGLEASVIGVSPVKPRQPKPEEKTSVAGEARLAVIQLIRDLAKESGAVENK